LLDCCCFTSNRRIPKLKAGNQKGRNRSRFCPACPASGHYRRGTIKIGQAKKDDGVNGVKQAGIHKNDRQGIDKPIKRLFDRKIGGSKISAECPATGKTADF